MFAFSFLPGFYISVEYRLVLFEVWYLFVINYCNYSTLLKTIICQDMYYEPQSRVEHILSVSKTINRWTVFRNQPERLIYLVNWGYLRLLDLHLDINKEHISIENMKLVVNHGNRTIIINESSMHFCHVWFETHPVLWTLENSLIGNLFFGLNFLDFGFWPNYRFRNFLA